LGKPAILVLKMSLRLCLSACLGCAASRCLLPATFRKGEDGRGLEPSLRIQSSDRLPILS
ncbi:hypothetical protein T4D_8770, partial [Trichinella pseudospiralis]